jgi:hypothetical protein
MSRLIQMQVCRKCNSKISGFSMEGYKMTMGRKLHTFSTARPSRMQELKVFKYSGGSTLWGDGRRCREQHRQAHNKNGEMILVSVPAKPKLKWLEHCVVITPFGKYQTITKFHHKTCNSMLGKQKQGWTSWDCKTCSQIRIANADQENHWHYCSSHQQ